MPDPAASSEQARQRDLDSYRLLDTSPEDGYDEIVRLASYICGVPIALVSLIDRERQWFKARTGIDAKQTPREYAFCDHAIRDPSQLLEVTDASLDPRFASNPLVTSDPGIRFYAGMPLVTPEGRAVGTVCVIDRQPRTLDDAQREAMRSLSRLTVALMEARRRALADTRAQARQEARLRRESGRYAVAIVQVAGTAGPVTKDVLQGIKRAVQACLDSADIVSPHADNELLVVLSDAARLQTAERCIREAVAALSPGLVLRIGAAAADTADEAMEAVFLRADEVLSASHPRR